MLYMEGTKRLETDLNIEHMIKNLRNIKMIIKKEYFDSETKFKI